MCHHLDVETKNLKEKTISGLPQKNLKTQPSRRFSFVRLAVIPAFWLIWSSHFCRGQIWSSRFRCTLEAPCISSGKKSPPKSQRGKQWQGGERPLIPGVDTGRWERRRSRVTFFFWSGVGREKKVFFTRFDFGF